MTEVPPGSAKANSYEVALSLAGICVAIESPLCPPQRAWSERFQAFLVPADSCQTDALFRCGSEDRRPEDPRFAATYINGAWSLGSQDGRSLYRFSDHRRLPYLWAEAAPDYSSVEIWVEHNPDSRIPPLSTPVDRVLCMGVLARHDTFVVHSCGWRWGDKVILFPGISGAGKSTLCRQLMASGQGTVLSDDRMLLRAGPAGFTAHGSPWPGDARQAVNDSAPLVAICFLEKTSAHHLIPIGPAETLRRLLAVTSVPWFDEALRDRVLPLVDRLVATVPAYRLGFRPQPDVVEVVRSLAEAGRPPAR